MGLCLDLWVFVVVLVVFGCAFLLWFFVCFADLVLFYFTDWRVWVELVLWFCLRCCLCNFVCFDRFRVGVWKDLDSELCLRCGDFEFLCLGFGFVFGGLSYCVFIVILVCFGFCRCLLLLWFVLDCWFDWLVLGFGCLGWGWLVLWFGVLLLGFAFLFLVGMTQRFWWFDLVWFLVRWLGWWFGLWFGFSFIGLWGGWLLCFVFECLVSGWFWVWVWLLVVGIWVVLRVWLCWVCGWFC